MILTEKQLDRYLDKLKPNQTAIIRILRGLVTECEPGINEHINDGKWLNGYLYYTIANNQFIYAIGPTASDTVSMHLMTLYGSQELRDKYKDQLAGLVSGKSCLKFKTPSAIPQPTLRDILTGGSAKVVAFYEAHKKK